MGVTYDLTRPWPKGLANFILNAIEKVHCGVRIVERMLGLTQDDAQGPPGAGGRPDTAVAKQIKVVVFVASR